MRIVQTAFGIFHHFELARELHRRGHLECIYSTAPWLRLRREGLPRDLVETFPYLQALEYALGRAPIDLRWLSDPLGYAQALAFDRFTLRRLQRLARPPQALIGLSGSSLSTGRWLQQQGGLFFCDRGSTHQRFQQEILADEWAHWGVGRPVSDERDTLREEAIYAQADAIVVPSTFAAESFLQLGTPAEKLHVIPYGVRLDKFQPAAVADLAVPDPAAFEVLFAGAVGLRKGLPYLLQAFAALRHPHKRLRIAGYLQEDIKSVLPRLPMESVEMLGPVPQPELARLMAASHVLVLPSIEEGLALVQAQALACGCPVIATPNTGAADLFTDGMEGFLVPVRSSSAIAERLEQLAADPALRARMSAAALARVHALGGWSTYGDRWENLLHSLIPGTDSLSS